MHQHIGIAKQVHQQRAIRIAAQIKAERTLAAIDRDEGGGGALMHGRAPAARIIAAFGAFQLDHLGAQHGKDLAHEGPRQILCDFNHSDTGQRRHANTLFKRGKE